MTSRRVEYEPLEAVTPATRNPKAHDLGSIVVGRVRFHYKLRRYRYVERMQRAARQAEDAAEAKAAERRKRRA